MVCLLLLTNQSCKKQNAEINCINMEVGLEIFDGSEFPVGLHINVYGSSLCDKAGDKEGWKTLCWTNIDIMEEEDTILEKLISYENLHIGFAGNTKHSAEEYSYSLDSLRRQFQDFPQDISNTIRKNMVIPAFRKGVGVATCALCRIDGSVRIVADKTLFGREPGTDISDRFLITATMPYVRFCFPSFEAVKSETQSLEIHLNQYFVKDMVFAASRRYQGLYEIAFAELPEERYEKLTLDISLPVTFFCNDRGNYYNHEQMVAGSTTIYFGKSAQENWHLNKVERMKGSFNREAIEYW